MPALRRATVVAAFVCCLTALPARAQSGKDAKPATKGPRNVAIIVHEGVELLDFAGPGEVFAAAGRAFRVYTVAETTAPITSQRFLKVTPNYGIADCPKPDVIVIPGGDTGVLLRNPAMMAWVKKASADAEVTFSVCTGAFVLAELGMLDGREATTHHGSRARLAQRYAKVKVRDDKRFVDNGSVVTAAGVSAGIDGALHVVARLCGQDAARQTAHYMEYRWEPDPSQGPAQGAKNR